MADKIPTGSNRTADQAYYASRRMSAINNQHVMTRRGRPGEPMHIPSAPGFDPNDTSTDRYYCSGGSKRSNRGVPKGDNEVRDVPHKVARNGAIVPASQRDTSEVRQARQQKLAASISGRRGPKPGTIRNAEGAGDVARPIRVRDKSEVLSACELVCDALNTGAAVVYVEAADAGLETRVRTSLELAIARKKISTARNVKIRLIPSHSQLIKEIVGIVKPPTETVNTGAGQVGIGEDIDDFEAFVKGSNDLGELAEPPEPPPADIVDTSVGITHGGLVNPKGTSSVAAQEDKPAGNAVGESPRGRVVATKPPKGSSGKKHRADYGTPPIEPIAPVSPADDTDG